jgi:hypothetical protein
MSEHTLVSQDEVSYHMPPSAKPSIATSNVVPTSTLSAVSTTNIPENIPKYDLASSIWKLPGLDKTTFYGAALYLHAAAKGQLRETKHRGDDWKFDPHASITHVQTKDFLDRLADCFARSKSIDAQDHVSATTMEFDVDLLENRRNIKIYVAKNLSGKNIDAPKPQENDSMINEDEEFANKMCKWFNDMSSMSYQIPEKEILDVMYTYNASRLTFYVCKIRDWTSSEVPGFDVWHVVEPVVSACKRFRTTEATREKLNSCARAASKCRSHSLFQEFGENLDGVTDNGETKLQYRNLEKWINYLGRLDAAYMTFRAFCMDTKRRDYTYEISVLKSPAEEKWPIDTYKKAIESWTGDLGLDDKRKERLTVRSKLDELAVKCRGTARVHCEIQLLNYFIEHGTTKDHVDYIGCSKKSCWLCWQLLGHYGRFSTKATHRMIYPMWAVPTNFNNTPRKAQFAAAITRTYKDMITLIEDKVLFQKEFSSRMNISHTSFRLNQDPSTQTSMSGSTLVSSNINLSSSESIIKQGRAPVATIKVVHFPADSPQPQLVPVDVFERLVSDYGEGCMNMRPVLLEPRFVDRSRQIVFPFQLNTKALTPNPNLLEWQSATWCIEYQPWISNNNVLYATMFRLDEENEKPNPWLVKVLENHHGDSFQEDLVPWYGDAFVIAVRRVASYQPDLVVNMEDDAMRLDECVEAITVDLTSPWELSRYLSIRGHHLELLQRSHQLFINPEPYVVAHPLD